MSCYYKATSRLIPQLLLLACPGEQVILVSPWIQNVLLIPPIFRTQKGFYKSGQIQLRDLLLHLTQDFDIYVAIIVRGRDNRVESVIRNWPRPDHLEIIEDTFVHAKAVVTSSFALTGSINLLPMSLARNREHCTLSVNKYKNARKWVRESLNLWL